MSQKYVYNPLTCEYDIINLGAPYITGPRGQVGAIGPAGPPGNDGADGEGVPTGGSTGQILAKASGADYDTEWVTEQASVTPDLQAVVDAGDTVVDKVIWVKNAADTTRVYINDEYIQVEDSTSHEAATIYPFDISLSNRQGGTGWLLSLYGNSEDGPGIQFNLDSAFTFLEMEPLSTGGKLYLPGASTPETLATREWVSGQIGSTPDLAAVTAEGASTASPISITDSGETLDLEPGSIGVDGTDGTVDITPGAFAIVRDTGDSISLLSASETLLSGEVDGKNINLKSPATGDSELFLPETDPMGETIATREWVKQHGDTASRPAPVQVGHQYFDTTLGHPIWYDGSQWVDAEGTAV